MPEIPQWHEPSNIAKAIEDGDGMWEDERWSPIMLSASAGTEYEGRTIPIAWQIEFDPSDDDFEAANARLEEIGVEPDGYGWGEYLQKVLQSSNPSLAKKLHIEDCETATCVIWVESPEDCRAILEATWKLIFEE